MTAHIKTVGYTVVNKLKGGKNYEKDNSSLANEYTTCVYSLVDTLTLEIFVRAVKLSCILKHKIHLNLR